MTFAMDSTFFDNDTFNVLAYDHVSETSSKHVSVSQTEYQPKTSVCKRPKKRNKQSEHLYHFLLLNSYLAHHTMRLWHYASQAILAQDPLITSLSASSTTATQSIPNISPAIASPSDPAKAIMATPSNKPTNTTLYFGYGSNLWLDQMHQRCPNSSYLGIARLNNFKWIINERGYANVVEIEKGNDATTTTTTTIPRTPETETQQTNKPKEQDFSTQVWGLVYSLQPSDEARLDRNEGVPVAYAKEWMGCDFWAVNDDDQGESFAPANETSSRKPEKFDLLVYINRGAVTPSKPKREYVYRMNMGIRDAVKAGVPVGYVEEVMRGFIPEMEDEGVVEVAERQALEFEDER